MTPTDATAWVKRLKVLADEFHRPLADVAEAGGKLVDAIAGLPDSFEDRIQVIEDALRQVFTSDSGAV